MLRLLQTIFWWVARWAVRRRYAVQVVGLEALRDLQGPTLVLPNHPGYIDPALVLSHVRLAQPVRPVVMSSMYRRPFLLPLMRLVQALEVPDLSVQSLSARDRTLAMIDAVVAGLERGECFLIYPAGRAIRNGQEMVGGTRTVAEVLERCPQANVLLVRTRGLWGSMFTYARGGAPNLAQCTIRGLAWMAANLLVFAPRRRIVITVERVARDRLPAAKRETLNPFLEAWYNQEGPETPVFVPYHAWFGPRQYTFPRPGDSATAEQGQVRRATLEAVCELLEERLGRPLTEHERTAGTTLDELGLDSLDRMDLALQIEDRFGFRAPHVAQSVGELGAVAEGLVAATDEASSPVPALWQQAPRTPKPMAVLADTIPEAFVRRALEDPAEPAVADRLSGTLSYRRMLVAAQLLAGQFRALPGDAVGVLLPASVGADLAFFGLQLAGKLPVMLNWTTGPGNLAYAVEKLALRRVISSRKLIDRLGIEVPGAEYVFLEDLRARIGKLAALWAMLAVRLFPRRWLRRVPRPQLDDPAVVLFTSGSESVPKAVPLSHRNLLTNARAAIEVLQLTNRDRMLGFLPPFHSFGLLGNVVAPVLGGLRMVHYADPTHAAGLLRTAAAYRVTLLITTPTFLSYMLALAQGDDLSSLRIIVTGAEKCPETVFTRVAQLAPQATIIEGYGITECSPVVAANRPDRIKQGTVGLPLRDVEVRVVDPDTHQPVPSNTTGMLLVRGPSVFGGYLHYDGPDPFVEVDGQRWYVTGDLVQIDPEGFIHFRGRLKRFLKIAGEMVSLPALEEPLAQRWPPTDSGPQVAVEGIDTPGGRRIVLFTTQDIALREANALLAEAGFRGVMRLDEVRRVDAIPVLGTGKTDYKVLRQALTAEAEEGASGSRSRADQECDLL
jgi:long-chain-fatty-acid--[acyl-carrier-protein] ligase